MWIFIDLYIYSFIYVHAHIQICVYMYIHICTRIYKDMHTAIYRCKFVKIDQSDSDSNMRTVLDIGSAETDAQAVHVGL